MHPVIAMWSHPRSMSTAVERVMRERGDLQCLHEPFMYFYYVERKVREMPLFDVDPDKPTSYEDIRDMILSMAKTGPVFFKDMSYYVLPHILEDREFCERLTNCFLVRDPVASIVSYFKLDPDLTDEEIGLDAQWRHLQALEERYPDSTAVIDADAVRADTEGVMTALWRRIGLPAVADAFLWDTDDTPDDWKQVEGWHGTASSTNRIRPLDAAETERRAVAFEALAADHPRLRSFLDRHGFAYEQLKARAIGPMDG